MNAVLWGIEVPAADLPRIKRIADVLWGQAPARLSENEAKRLAVLHAVAVLGNYREEAAGVSV